MWEEMEEAFGELKNWDQMGEARTRNHYYVRFLHGFGTKIVVTMAFVVGE